MYLLKITKDRLKGPLENLISNNQYIDNFNNIETVSIGFIGDTYSGKSNFIKNIINTLGGIYQDKVESEYKSGSQRTLKDSSYIFGEYLNLNGKKQFLKINLKSHAGHRIKYGENGPKCKNNIIVLKSLKSSTFDKQLSIVNPILDSEKIKYSDSIALVTRVETLDNLITRRKNSILNKNFKDIYCIDNKPNKKDYHLDNLNFKNIELILKVLENKYKNLNLVYFGFSKINDISNIIQNNNLVNYSNGFKIKDILDNKIFYEDDLECQKIWEIMQKEKIIY